MPADRTEPIPVIDLFAGPGGLGEGFSRYPLNSGGRFKIALSIEKDAAAHKTLTLRAFFRQFDEGTAPDEYYAYLRGEIGREALFDQYPEEARAAKDEARLLTLGEDDVNPLIAAKIKNAVDWVLIGGPPCQAYSLVGRSRMLGAIEQEKGESEEEFKFRKNAEFEKDHRHQLYKEYLKILADHAPPVFVMENVKGILSSKLNGRPIFPEILSDLRNPRQALNLNGKDLSYQIFSLVKKSFDLFGETVEPSDFIIKAEDYGSPQARHRVILLGVRTDISYQHQRVIAPKASVSVESAIGDLPPRTSGISEGGSDNPREEILKITETDWWTQMNADPKLRPVRLKMEQKLKQLRKRPLRGSQFETTSKEPLDTDWFHDPNLGGICNHETRSHIPGDIHRYFFCACFGEVKGRSPQLKDFPKGLLPKHKNVKEALKGQKFGDRFRVQIGKKPATTVTSHISKDGHYFIHPDPKQCRSLTVREAARLQTFPDNYFFEGPRTQQFHQVGNAVPPKLAYQIAQIIEKILLNN